MLQLTWYGTAAIALQSDAGRVLFDPFVPLAHSNIPVTIADFDGYSDVFVTHGHIDHIDTLPELVHRNPDLRIHCTDTPYHTLRRRHVPSKNLVRFSYGEVCEVAGLRVTPLHGKHAKLPRVTKRMVHEMLRSPARDNLPHLVWGMLSEPEHDETAAFLVEAEGKRILLLGSLNLRPDTWYPTEPDVLVLPYNGWTDNFPPAKRVLAAIRPKRVLLDHYDNSFPPVSPAPDLWPVLSLSPKVEALSYKKPVLL